MSDKSKSKKHKHRTRGFLHFLLWVFAGFVIAGGVALYNASALLRLNDAPKPSDAIVVPGGNPVRAYHAAKLYRDGYAKVIYVDKPALSSGEKKIRDSGLAFPREEELTAQILMNEGVPQAALRFFGPTKSTAEEAKVLARTFSRKPCSLLVVTSPYHARRARIIFRDIVTQCTVTVVGTPDEEFPDAWWKDQDAARHVMLEPVKIIFYKLGGIYSAADS